MGQHDGAVPKLRQRLSTRRGWREGEQAGCAGQDQKSCSAYGDTLVELVAPTQIHSGSLPDVR